MLCEYEYPGNIRELRNLVERIAIMIPKKEIKADVIVPLLGMSRMDKSDIFSESMPLSQAQKEFLKKYIERQVELHKYNYYRNSRCYWCWARALTQKNKGT